MTRRAVLAVLLVVGVLTTYYAVGAVSGGDGDGDGDAETVTAVDTATDEVVTAVRPSTGFDGPLRLGRTLVVGRQGDPVTQPENTAESFATAFEIGVDYVEADVAMTRDGQLLVRSSNELSRTTDVSARPEFADRRTTKTIDGNDVTDWFSEDFTLAELRTLRAVEPVPEQRPESASHDGEYALIGFDDLVTQVKEASDEAGRDIGIFVRPLRSAYFRGIDLPVEPAIIRSLTRSRLVQDPERVTVESPDLQVLQRIEDSVGDNVLTAYVVPAASAVELDDLTDLPGTLDAVAVEVATFAGLGVRGVCDLGARARDAGLALVVFPVSYENALLGERFRSADPDPGAPGDLLGQLSALVAIRTDVIVAESPREVIQLLGEVPPGQEDRCA